MAAKSKHYSVELEREDAEKFKEFLKKNGTGYEASEAYNLIHFELYLSLAEVLMIEAYLEKEVA